MSQARPPLDLDRRPQFLQLLVKQLSGDRTIDVNGAGTDGDDVPTLPNSCCCSSRQLIPPAQLVDGIRAETDANASFGDVTIVANRVDEIRVGTDADASFGDVTIVANRVDGLCAGTDATASFGDVTIVANRVDGIRVGTDADASFGNVTIVANRCHQLIPPFHLVRSSCQYFEGSAVVALNDVIVVPFNDVDCRGFLTFCDAVIAHDFISRKHCQVEATVSDVIDVFAHDVIAGNKCLVEAVASDVISRNHCLVAAIATDVINGKGHCCHIMIGSGGGDQRRISCAFPALPPPQSLGRLPFDLADQLIDWAGAALEGASNQLI